MDQQEQGPDQREQLGRVKRSKADWEQLACKVLLLFPDYAKMLREQYHWKNHRRYDRDIGNLMGWLQVRNTCERCTFANGITAALRRMTKNARDQVNQEKRSDRCNRTK